MASNPKGVGARGDPTPGAGLSTKASCCSCSFCSRSAIRWNVELQSSMGSLLGPREREVGTICEDLKEGPQMEVRIKDHIEIGVGGQQLSREMCFGACRGTVCLNPKDTG